jgi:hypothetical protein
MQHHGSEYHAHGPAAHSKKELLAIHGVGPRAITILDAALAAKGRRFRAS